MMVSWHEMTILYKISGQPFCLAVRLLSWCLCILCSYNPCIDYLEMGVSFSASVSLPPPV